MSVLYSSAVAVAVPTRVLHASVLTRVLHASVLARVLHAGVLGRVVPVSVVTPVLHAIVLACACGLILSFLSWSKLSSPHATSNRSISVGGQSNAFTNE